MKYIQNYSEFTSNSLAETIGSRFRSIIGKPSEDDNIAETFANALKQEFHADTVRTHSTLGGFSSRNWLFAFPYGSQTGVVVLGKTSTIMCAILEDDLESLDKKHERLWLHELRNQCMYVLNRHEGHERKRVELESAYGGYFKVVPFTGEMKSVTKQIMDAYDRKISHEKELQKAEYEGGFRGAMTGANITRH